MKIKRISVLKKLYSKDKILISLLHEKLDKLKQIVC